MNKSSNAREDWDYVSMENYTKDTKELAEQAAYIIGGQKKKINELEKLIGLLVHCAGRIEVPNWMIVTEQPTCITRYERPDIDATIFEKETA